MPQIIRNSINPQIAPEFLPAPRQSKAVPAARKRVPALPVEPGAARKRVPAAAPFRVVLPLICCFY